MACSSSSDKMGGQSEVRKEDRGDEVGEVVEVIS